MSFEPAHLGYLLLRARLRCQRRIRRCDCVSGIPLSCSSSSAGGLRGCFRTQYHITIRRKRNLRNPSRTMLPSSLSEIPPSFGRSLQLHKACHDYLPSWVSLISWKLSRLYPCRESFLQKGVHDCDVRFRTRYALHADLRVSHPAFRWHTSRMPGSTISARIVGWVIECAEPRGGLCDRQNAPQTLERDTSYSCVVDYGWMGLHWSGERDGTSTADVSHGLRRRSGRPAPRETRPLRRMLVR